jgi:hypothetical protein
MSTRIGIFGLSVRANGTTCGVARWPGSRYKRALVFDWSMMFSENRYTLFRIML